MIDLRPFRTYFQPSNNNSYLFPATHPFVSLHKKETSWPPSSIPHSEEYTSRPVSWKNKLGYEKEEGSLHSEPSLKTKLINQKTSTNKVMACKGPKNPRIMKIFRVFSPPPTLLYLCTKKKHHGHHHQYHI